MGVRDGLALDVFNPPNPPNPYWLGAVQLYLSCPSANFNNQYIGQVELTGRPLNKFSTLTYPIPAPIKTVLQGSHPDCFFSIAVNSNATPTPPVLDNLRFKSAGGGARQSSRERLESSSRSREWSIVPRAEGTEQIAARCGPRIVC